MNDDVFRLQLLALRAQLDVIIAAITPPPEVNTPEPGACSHPEDARQDASSLRSPGRFLCTACGAMVEPGKAITVSAPEK